MTLPDTFITPDTDPRPAPLKFSTDMNFDWNVDWQYATPSLAGECANPPAAL